MEFRLLGTVETADGGWSPTAAKQRVLLAACLLTPRRAVSTERLIEAIWGTAPPATASALVQSYVCALRRALPKPDLLQTRPPGYLMDVDPGQVDVHRFTDLTARGRRALVRQRHAEASAILRHALGLWRGAAFGGEGESFLRAEAARLEEMRLAALEDRVAAELWLGEGLSLVPELVGLVVGHPLRERLRGQLMVALHQSGRRAEALEVYRETRRVLAEELGLDPCQGLQRLHEAILNEDPELPTAFQPGDPRRQRRGA
ncbi:AfsR/SARP family transcriptional regulator [Actinomadura hibisca]|uniref:AfsR/SARP family transcriptional regulator n=1 Tax=Actinomadura hibisca TaxID=68565 RepID=UPI00083297CC|nr:AfsR/SARP family transcriptional regulator [Actinomadura hibisca]